MPPEAYEIGLKPWEYERLTPAQYAAMVAARSREREHLRATLAWLISWVTAPHVKRAISTDKILGKNALGERRVFTEVGEPEPPRIYLTDAE